MSTMLENLQKAAEGVTSNLQSLGMKPPYRVSVSADRFDLLANEVGACVTIKRPKVGQPFLEVGSVIFIREIR